jgi:hypothetical protein
MQNIQNINFVLIGARATGKTVYLASLFLNEKSITSEDKHTMEYLKPLADTLVNGAYPQATSGTLHELMFNYKSENVSCQIQIDDVDGHFIETLHKEDEATQSERDRFIANIKNSEGIIFFFPFEGRFNEESIKSFNYEIDTIISEITKMYGNHDSIPIPAVIAVTKWDRSPDFKAENEDDKALEYINTHEFLKRAKEKIEHYFSNLSIIPISATGKDIEQMQPYNLTKPLEFFIDNTYRLWEKKIENLKEKKRELLKFLSRVYFDMKFYKEGKYNRLYDELEKEFADEIRLKAEGREDYLQFSSLEKEYKDVLPYLLQKNRDEIEEIGKKLKSKQTIKKASWGTGIIVAVSLLGFGVAGWYIKTKLLQTESELFSDIEVEYKHGSYQDVLNDVLKYQDKFKDTLNIEHKKRVEEIKNNIMDKQFTLEADNLIANSELDNVDDIDDIDELLKKFTSFGFKNQDIIHRLIDKKNEIEKNSNYNDFKMKISKSNYKDMISMVESDWSDEYNKKQINIIKKILLNKFNDKVEAILKKTPSSIGDIDEYNDLKERLSKIKSLEKNTIIEKIQYRPTLNSDNSFKYQEKLKTLRFYTSVLKNGVTGVKVTFGANSKENEPLGFECSSEGQIILKIDTAIYNYKDDYGSCQGLEITWASKQLFQQGSYHVEVIEKDLVDNDHFKFNFELNGNQLIKMKNRDYFKIKINNDYYISFGKEEK